MPEEFREHFRGQFTYKLLTFSLRHDDGLKVSLSNSLRSFFACPIHLACWKSLQLIYVSQSQTPHFRCSRYFWCKIRFSPVVCHGLFIPLCLFWIPFGSLSLSLICFACFFPLIWVCFCFTNYTCSFLCIITRCFNLHSLTRLIHSIINAIKH